MVSVVRKDKPLAWLHGEVKSPPFSKAARIETGYLLRELQKEIRQDPGRGLGRWSAAIEGIR
jgi:hypothetical protein